MRTNYVLIDYENVQPEKLSTLDQEMFKILVFVGANQSKLSFETAAAVQILGGKASYIKISGTGHNALDFHIAYYIGQLATLEPEAFFHIISKDEGFDPLIQHLKTRGTLVMRSSTILDIPLLKATSSKSVDERVDLIVTKLQQLKLSKPRAVKTLSSTINAVFQKQLSEEEISALLKVLEAKGVISVEGTKVSYPTSAVSGSPS